MKFIEKHIFFMRHCTKLGRIAKICGDSTVCAIIVKLGDIIAKGVEANNSKSDITCHAEIAAIMDACKK